MFEGRDLCAASSPKMREVRGAGIAMIFQEPMTALNPLRTIGDQIARDVFDPYRAVEGRDQRAGAGAAARTSASPIPKAAAKAYPHELSGGQRQRAMIAMALALDPKLLIADEPTTALDVTTQAQILKLIRDLQQRRRTAVMFITHDFGVVAEIADRVVVMQHGVMVEQGAAATVLNTPQHAYTKQLIAAVPPLKAPPPRSAGGRQHPDDRATSRRPIAPAAFSGAARRVTPAVKDVVAQPAARRDARHRRRIRLGQIDAGALHRAADRSGYRLDHARWQRLGKDDARGNVRRETRHIQMVFQDPFASLNPRRKAGELVAQGPIVHGTPRAQAIAEAQGTVRAGRARSVVRRPLSARILRRPAPAHRPRARAGAEAGRAGRGRAGLGARRLRAGAGAEAARRIARAARAFHRLHHA